MVGSIKLPLVILDHHHMQQWRAGVVGGIAVLDVVIRGHCYFFNVVVLSRKHGDQRSGVNTLYLLYAHSGSEYKYVYIDTYIGLYNLHT